MNKKKLYEDLISDSRRGSRYSFYPPRSQWNNEVKSDVFELEKDNIIDLYLHIPFCEKLCTFCGCNIFISKDENLKDIYLNKVVNEWKDRNKKGRLKISNMHIGGGTPNTLSSTQLDHLLNSLNLNHTEEFNGLCEIDPRSINIDFFKVLNHHRFNKISIGVQDFNQKVLENVNRLQTKEDLEKAIYMANKAEINKFNFDFIYGLPYQTTQSIIETLKSLIDYLPESIAFYPLAKVPWLSAHQNAFGNFNDIKDDQKFEMFVEGDSLLKDLNYTHIGLGHYALKESSLEKAFRKNSIFRSISGYQENQKYPLVGLGVSAISEGEKQIIQNPKVLDQYLLYGSKTYNKFVTAHYKSSSEVYLAKILHELICSREVNLKEIETKLKIQKNQVHQLILKNQLALNETKIKPTHYGSYFLKRICEVIDPLTLDSN